MAFNFKTFAAVGALIGSLALVVIGGYCIFLKRKLFMPK